jgi:hypothetical protein
MIHFQVVVDCSFQWAKRQKRGYDTEIKSGLKEQKSSCLLCFVVEIVACSCIYMQVDLQIQLADSDATLSF